MKKISLVILFVLSSPLYGQEKITKETLHRQAIQEKLSSDMKPSERAIEKEIIQEVYGVMDAFMAKNIEELGKRIHPRMLEFDSMSPYRDVGKASFLEHMYHFFASPQHIEDHYIRIKEPLVQGYGDNVAVVSFVYDAEASVGQQFVQNWGKASFVFVKDKSLGADMASRWLLAVCHYTTIRPSLR